MSGARKRIGTARQPARACLASALLSTLLGALAPVSEARAASRPSYEWGETVSVKLRNGRGFVGKYRGTIGSWSDAAGYAARYAAWRDSTGATLAPALGDSLVVALEPGTQASGPFQGFGPRSILLGTADSCAHLLIALDRIGSVRSASSAFDSVAVETWSGGPQCDAITIESRGRIWAVPAAAIASGEARDPADRGDRNAILVVVVGLGLALLLAGVAMGHAMEDSAKQ